MAARPDFVEIFNLRRFPCAEASLLCGVRATNLNGCAVKAVYNGRLLAACHTHISPASPARTAPTWRNCCWTRATRSTAPTAAPARSTSGASRNSASRPPEPELVEYDLTDLGSSIRLLQNAAPDEVYNLAAQSFVGVSFEQPLPPRRSPASAPEPARGHPHRQPEDPLLPGVAPPKCSARCRPSRRSKTRPSTRAAPTAWPSCTRTG
jgi:hypothetical protein